MPVGARWLQSILAVLICFVAALNVISLAAPAGSIRASWNLNGFQLTREPSFDMSRVPRPGTLILQLDLDPEGGVKRVDVIAGETELRPAVVDSVQNWRFVKVANLPSSLRVWIYFIGNNGRKPEQNPPPLPPPPYGAVVGSIDIDGVSSEEKEQLLKKMGIRVGDKLTEEAWNRAGTAAKSAVPPLHFRVTLGANGLLIRVSR